MMERLTALVAPNMRQGKDGSRVSVGNQGRRSWRPPNSNKRQNLELNTISIRIDQQNSLSSTIEVKDK